MAKKKAKSKSGIYIIIGILIIAGTYFYNISPQNSSNAPSSSVGQEVEKDKQPETNSSSTVTKDKTQTQTPEKSEKPKKNTLPPIPVQETDDTIGEFKVEGIVQAIDEAKQVITIEQILDDNSQQVKPDVKVSKEAIVQNSRGKIKLSEIQVGSTINLIIMKNGYARSVTVVE